MHNNTLIKSSYKDPLTYEGNNEDLSEEIKVYNRCRQELFVGLQTGALSHDKISNSLHELESKLAIIIHKAISDEGFKNDEQFLNETQWIRDRKKNYKIGTSHGIESSESVDNAIDRLMNTLNSFKLDAPLEKGSLAIVVRRRLDRETRYTLINRLKLAISEQYHTIKSKILSGISQLTEYYEAQEKQNLAILKETRKEKNLNADEKALLDMAITSTENLSDKKPLSYNEDEQELFKLAGIALPPLEYKPTSETSEDFTFQKAESSADLAKKFGSFSGSEKNQSEEAVSEKSALTLTFSKKAITWINNNFDKYFMPSVTLMHSQVSIRGVGSYSYRDLVVHISEAVMKIQKNQNITTRWEEDVLTLDFRNNGMAIAVRDLLDRHGFAISNRYSYQSFKKG
jgi:hypothetical protein